MTGDEKVRYNMQKHRLTDSASHLGRPIGSVKIDELFQNHIYSLLSNAVGVEIARSAAAEITSGKFQEDKCTFGEPDTINRQAFFYRVPKIAPDFQYGPVRDGKIAISRYVKAFKIYMIAGFVLTISQRADAIIFRYTD
jgi:hypothetical protein